MSKLAPDVAHTVEIRLVAAEVLIRMARRSLHPADVLRLIDAVRKELDDAVQCVDAGKAEQALLTVTSGATATNDTKGVA